MSTGGHLQKKKLEQELIHMIHRIIQGIHIVHYSMDLEGLRLYKREMLSKTSDTGEER